MHSDPLIFVVRYTTIKDQHQINEEIRDKEVRLIGENGEQLGIVSSREALALSEERELDLVKISPNSNPPVCKIMNYGKFLFEQNKRGNFKTKNKKLRIFEKNSLFLLIYWVLCCIFPSVRCRKGFFRQCRI